MWSKHSVTRRVGHHRVKCFSHSLPANRVQGTVGGVGEQRWGTGKTIGDLVLFWETNKRANATPVEACGPAGCHASQQMCETSGGSEKVMSRVSQQRIRASDETQPGAAATGVSVTVCVWESVCVCDNVFWRVEQDWPAVLSGHNITTKTAMMDRGERVINDPLITF